ncbi:MAG: DUF2865 domain-containing protein, partial [Methylocystis sp.]|nr:DUF2865 domain-containing protein [Methylocystis sp.]
YAQGRRHGIERRSYAERRAAERRAERYQRRIAEIRASEKRRLAARRANEARYAEAQNGWREIAANVEAEQFNKPDAVKRAETTQIAAPAAGSGPAAASPQVAAPQSTAKRAANGQYVPRAIVKPVDPAAAKPNEQPAIKPAEQDNKLAEKTAEPPLPPVIDRGSGERPSAPVEIAAPAADSSVGGSIVSRRPICVRACDGFYFPIANRESEVSAQQSCEKLCPGAQTAVFLMPGGSTRIEEAVSARGGETYAQFVARLRPEDARSKSCACPSTVMGSLPETSAFLSDLTLRPGDTIVTPQGMRVVRRGSHYPFKKSDFLSLAETRNISAATRGALAAIEKAMKTPHGRLAVASNSDRRRHRNDL